MSDEEIYKITFDLDGGVANELNSLNNKLSQIQMRTKVLDKGFKDKAEQSALVGAFASGMQMEKNKSTVSKNENKILRQVIIKEKQVEKKWQGNVISYATFADAVEKLRQEQIVNEKMKPFARLGQNQYPRVLKQLETRTLEYAQQLKINVELVKSNAGWKRLVEMKDRQIFKLNTAIDTIYSKLYFRSGGNFGMPGRLRPQKIRDIGDDLFNDINNFIMLKERIGS